MYQVSEALDKVISGSGRTFYARLNGISEGIQEIVQTNFSTPDSYFYVGGATASKIEVSMFTKSQDFVKGAEVRLEIGATADGTIEWIPMGYFTIKEQKKDRNLLTFTAYDRLESKLAKAYKSKITSYPVESKEFLTDISKQTGVEFDTSKLSDNLIIDKILTVNDQSGEKAYKEPFDGFTMQQVVGYIAQLHGTFAICDRNGKVTFRWYGTLATDHPGKIGDTAGSYLEDQNLSFIYNTIEFLKESHTYLIKTNRYFDDLLQSETMCQISGISCDTENNHYESGTNINTNLSNPVMTQEWLDKILEKIKDTRYYPVSFSFMGDPRLDVGDVVTIVDAKNNLIDVPVMQHTITFDGGLLSEVASYGFEEKEVKSPSEIALQRVKDDILSLQEITAKKATFDQLNAVDAKITNLQASTITVNDANILFARLDKANIQQGWITSVMIGDAQITNAKIQDMSADKLTAGILDAEKVTLINLDAGSITTGTITGLDAIFNRSFTVNSPYSDTQSFIIEANQNNIIIGTRIKDVLYSTDDNSIIFSPTGVTLQGGNGVVGITAKHDVTIGSDGGSIYLNANGTTYNDIPIYARNDLYTFKILHEGNFENLITTVENSRNSKKLSGMEIVDSSKNISNAIPWIDQTGVMEIGKYLNFHEWNADTTDFSTRLEVFEKSLRITAGITTALDLNGVGNASYIKFSGSGTTLGWIGLNRKDGSLMLYDSSEKEYRILDETSISFGTAEPISDGRKGDIYVQTSDSGNGWKKAVAIYYYSN